MSEYTIKGKLDGRRLQIGWKNGQLTGDEHLGNLVRTDAKLLEGQAVGPVNGPYTYANHLASPLSALFLIRSFLDEAPTEFIGDIPTVVSAANKIY